MSAANVTPIRVIGTSTGSGIDVNIISSVTIAISASTLPLPTGAATEATLLAAKVDLDKFTFTSTRLLVDGSGVTQPISGSVAVSNFPASQAVTGTFFQATQPVSGPLTDIQLRASPVPVSGTITTSPNINVHDGSGNTIASTGTSLNVDVTNTIPVTGTFFQATQPVSGVGNFTVVQPTGTNLHAVLDSGSTTAITGSVSVTGPLTDTQLRATPVPISAASLPLPTGASTSALQTQPGVDIGDVTVNNGSGASAVNIQDGGNSITVDGTITTIFQTSTTPTLSNVAASASSVTLIAANSNRRIATIFNDSTSNLYVKFGSTASTTSFVVILTGNAYYELPQPIYTGIITGIWLAATGNARLTEVV